LFAALPPLAWSAVLVPLLALALLVRARCKLLFVLLAASCVMAGCSDVTLRAQALTRAVSRQQDVIDACMLSCG
jgi:hypothetical protein